MTEKCSIVGCEEDAEWVCIGIPVASISEAIKNACEGKYYPFCQKHRMDILTSKMEKLELKDGSVYERKLNDEKTC